MKIFPPHHRGRRPRRPASLAVSTAISFVLSAQCCSAQILDNPNLVTSSGTSYFCETEIEPFPYNVLVNFLLPQNRCRSLRICVALRDRKAVQVYASMLVLFDVWVLCAFWICSAPLSRLTPIEALPQTPLGALPPDPHNGFHPLTLTRGVPLDLLLASLGVGAQLWSALPIPNSSFLIPHSSLLTFYTCI